MSAATKIHARLSYTPRSLVVGLAVDEAFWEMGSRVQPVRLLAPFLTFTIWIYRKA